MSTTAREGNKEQLDTNGARQVIDKIFDPDDSEASTQYLKTCKPQY